MKFIPLVLLLAACGAQSVAEAEVALTGAEHAATVYLTQPACVLGKTAPTCSDPALAPKIKAADNVAYDAVQAAKGGKGSVAAAMAAVTALTSLIPVKQ